MIQAADTGRSHCRECSAHTCVYITCYKDNFCMRKQVVVLGLKELFPHRGNASSRPYERRIINMITNTDDTVSTTADKLIVAIVQVAHFDKTIIYAGPFFCSFSCAILCAGIINADLAVFSPMTNLFPFFSSTRHLSRFVSLTHRGQALCSHLGTRTTLVSSSTGPPTVVGVPVI